MGRVTIEELEGQAPVRGQGRFANEQAFEFRARHDSWQLRLLASPDAVEPAWVWIEPWGEGHYDASYMPLAEARAIIESCAAMSDEVVAPPLAYGGLSAAEVAARKFAAFAIPELWLWHGEQALESGQPLLLALAEPLAEARGSFIEEHGSALLPIFEEAASGLEHYTRRQRPHARWLFDAQSASAVGRRLRFALAHAPAAERDERRAQAMRWLAAWSAPGAARGAALAALG